MLAAVRSRTTKRVDAGKAVCSTEKNLFAVFGVERSGGSLLIRLLDGHEMLAVFPVDPGFGTPASHRNFEPLDSDILFPGRMCGTLRALMAKAGHDCLFEVFTEKRKKAKGNYLKLDRDVFNKSLDQWYDNIDNQGYLVAVSEAIFNSLPNSAVSWPRIS